MENEKTIEVQKEIIELKDSTIAHLEYTIESYKGIIKIKDEQIEDLRKLISL